VSAVTAKGVAPAGLDSHQEVLPMAGKLDGKVAVVTGASSGIGRAVTRRFLSEGALVVGVGRSEAKLKGTVAELGAGASFVAKSADLSTAEGGKAAVDAAAEAFGRVDILVNNAGVGYSYRDVRPGSMDTLGDSSIEDWNHVMSINLGSVVHCTQRAVQLMLESGGGAIVNVASVLGLVGNRDAHAYTTAKGAIINLTRSLATTYGRSNIRANVLAPGYIETPMVEQFIGLLNSEDYRYQWNPMGRMGKADEIANGALFLASDEASYCNGSVLTIDGGMLAAAP
jgi:meso-butanediol dehydrogenase / (S,S)-butanediol dehydrogenase / diacetyl reductase